MVEGGKNLLEDTIIDQFHTLNRHTNDVKSDSEMSDEESSDNLDNGSQHTIHLSNTMCAPKDMSERWLVLMEPISTISIDCTLGPKGRIFRIDDNIASILGYASMRELLGTKLKSIIPSINLDKEDSQYVCARKVKGNCIPLTVNVVAERDPNSQSVILYNVEIRALTAVSGVITVTDTGILHSFNCNFIEALVGKALKEEAVDGYISINDIIPGFYSYISPSSHLVSISNSQKKFRARNDEKNGVYSVRCTNSLDMCNLYRNFNGIGMQNSCSAKSDSVVSVCCLQPSTSTIDLYSSRKAEFDAHNITNSYEGQSKHIVREGSFFGLARHSDNSLIEIQFDIRKLRCSYPANWAVCIVFDGNDDFGCLSRDETNPQEESYETDEEQLNSLTFPFRGRRPSCSRDRSRDHSLEHSISDAALGEYSKQYETYQLIGYGTFGSVKLAARKDSGLLAVTKFICRAKVLPESWVQSPRRCNKMVPIELHLLETLRHPNIVRVLDVFENDIFYQLVMEKLGCGMDLFEFIEHQPSLDEPLISYIFKQVVSAISYLNSKNVVHRDVKDENVIIDHNFSCKLIDFGSAAYFGDNIMFSTFCGTMEYCSPEVLCGKRYYGPELEMWSLGVLLYTLIFFENPFRIPHDAVYKPIKFPWRVSEDLHYIIKWILHRDPSKRATIGEIERHRFTNQPVSVKQYSFQALLKNCVRVQTEPFEYAADFLNRLNNTLSCSSLVDGPQQAINEKVA